MLGAEMMAAGGYQQYDTQGGGGSSFGINQQHQVARLVSTNTLSHTMQESLHIGDGSSGPNGPLPHPGVRSLAMSGTLNCYPHDNYLKSEQ